MLLDGPRSILSPPVFEGASDGRSGVGVHSPGMCVGRMHSIRIEPM